jgi:hypothetical protein
MSFISLEQLPFVGVSYDEVNTPCGERRWIDRKAAWEAASDRAITSQTQGAPFSAYIVNAKPGQGPPLHKHPYVEVAFTLEGCATITVGDEQRENLSLVTCHSSPLITPARDLSRRISPEISGSPRSGLTYQ